MGKLIYVDELREAFSHDIMGGLNWDRILREAKPVDAIPIDWINLFNSTPIGGDSIDDLLREWQYKQEVEAERERDEDGNEVD